MICYLGDLTEREISAINDYWKLEDESSTEFLQTLDQINKYYQPENLRNVSQLIKKSRFYLDGPAFICVHCDKKIPAENRKGYQARIKSEAEVICSECLEIRQQKDVDDALLTLQEFKSDTFKPTNYLDDLSIDELLGLLSISSQQNENHQFLGRTLDDVPITGVSEIDEKLHLSLITKKAIVYIPDLPLYVMEANTVLYRESLRTNNHNRTRATDSYQHPESVTPGAYLNQMILEGNQKTSDISTILYHKLDESSLSIPEVEKIQQLIKEIQLNKLYRLVSATSEEYRLRINNSNTLSSLLNHLVKNYSPLNLYFTFRYKARDTVIYLRRERPNKFIERNCFTTFVETYIHYVESKKLKLDKTWGLPPELQTAPFEAFFSQLYLDEHFNWNKLSANEVVALWLRKIRLVDDTQED